MTFAEFVDKAKNRYDSFMASHAQQLIAAILGGIVIGFALAHMK